MLRRLATSKKSLRIVPVALTLANLANRCGVSSSHLGRIEGGGLFIEPLPAALPERVAKTGRFER